MLKSHVFIIRVFHELNILQSFIISAFGNKINEFIFLEILSVSSLVYNVKYILSDSLATSLYFQLRLNANMSPGYITSHMTRRHLPKAQNSSGRNRTNNSLTLVRLTFITHHVMCRVGSGRRGAPTRHTQASGHPKYFKDVTHGACVQERFNE